MVPTHPSDAHRASERLVTDHDQHDAADAPDAVPAPRGPVPDLGFFAGAPQAPGTSAIGGPAPASTGPFGAPAPSQFGSSPSAPSQFGGFASAPGQFGGAPTVPPPFGPPPGAGGGNGSTIKLVVAGVAIVLLLVAVLGGRFAWSQFMAEPVTPATLMGMPRVGDASVDRLIEDAQDQVADELSSGSAVRVALYGDGSGTGYMLFAARGGSRPGDGSGDDPFAGWTESRHGDVTCFSPPAQTGPALGATLCLRTFWRRAVFVMGMGGTAPDPTVVAQATDEAWDAQ